MTLNRTFFSIRFGSSAAALCLSFPFLVIASPVAAQRPATPTASAPRVALRPVADVVRALSVGADFVVLADTSVQGSAPLPAAPATAETVERQIEVIIRSLPAGTTWAKLYVPAPTSGRWNGDAVAAYARAQAQQVGRVVGRQAPSGMVEILGRNVPVEKSREYIDGLNLKLVYVLTNPRATRSPAPMAEQFRAMDPAQRAQAVYQLLADQAALWKSLSPEESAQLKSEMAQMKGAAGGDAGTGGKKP